MILVVAAFGVVYLVWGSTYLAILFAIETIPPFLMSGTRYVVAGILLYAFTRPRTSERLTIKNWLAAGSIGCLMLLGGNGLVCWAEQSVPSGLAALMIATVPLWMVTLNWLFFKGARPTAAIILGLVLGLIGLFVLIGPGSIGGEPVDSWGAIALMSACVFWSLGSLHSRHAHLPRSTFLATSMEMLMGGVALLTVGVLTGEWPKLDVAAVSLKSCLALGYLIVFGAILALTAYKWLLQVSTPARVSTYAYVNPVIAVLLGTAFAGEALTARIFFAAAVIVTAVIIITSSARRTKPTVVRQTYSVCDSNDGVSQCLESAVCKQT